MTDEELGRKWCAANGKAPSPDANGRGTWWWEEPGSLSEPGCELPSLLARGCDAEGQYRSEADAYAAVGAALRSVWAFADESRRQTIPPPQLVDPEEMCGDCPACGVRWHVVRPGKTQPSCDCYDTCGRCGAEYERVETPGHTYYGCKACGPHEMSKGDKATYGDGG